MTEHFTSNTESVWKWCNTCQKRTEHSVSSNRLGRCMEHGGKLVEKKEKPLETLDLFEKE